MTLNSCMCVSTESISVTGAWVVGCVTVAMDISIHWLMLVWLLTLHHHSEPNPKLILSFLQ